MGSLELPLLLVCRVPTPNLDQPNHLFLWACSQATKCSRRKLALKPIYNLQAQLDCQCCSAILLLTHDWFPFSFSIAAVPISYPSFSGLQTILSIHMCKGKGTVNIQIGHLQKLMSNPEAWTRHRPDECDEQWSRLIQKSRLEAGLKNQSKSVHWLLSAAMIIT